MNLNPTDFYVIITDGDAVDGIVQGKRYANAHASDLRDMGCVVTVLGPVNGRLADDMQAAFEAKPSVAALRRMMREQAQ